MSTRTDQPDAIEYLVRFHTPQGFKTAEFASLRNAIRAFHKHWTPEYPTTFHEHTVHNGWEWSNYIDDPCWWYHRC